MKLAGRVGIMLPAIIFLLAVLVYGAGYLLPGRTHTEGATYIDVAPEIVYGLMSDLRQFKQWAPWHDRDPAARYRVGQPDRGLGATLHWHSEDAVVGDGQLVILDAQPDNKLRMLMEYASGDRLVLAWRFEPLEEGTHIVWTLDIEHGENPFSRYRGLLVKRRLTAAFEPGLDRLRRLAECQPVPPTPNIVTEEISYQVNEQSVTGYLAYDQNRKNRPGVLIVPEGRGHAGTAHKRAEQLAELGYVALILDIAGAPGGSASDDPVQTGQSTAEVKANFEKVKQHFMAALEILKQHAAANSERIAAVGYGIGGNIVLNMARAGVELDGVVSFHGPLEPTGKKAQQGEVKASVLVLNGIEDPLVPPEQRRAFIEEMDAAGVDYEFINYPGAKHDFTNPEVDDYSAGAIARDGGSAKNEGNGFLRDKDAWQKMQAFLARVLR